MEKQDARNGSERPGRRPVVAVAALVLGVSLVAAIAWNVLDGGNDSAAPVTPTETVEPPATTTAPAQTTTAPVPRTTPPRTRRTKGFFAGDFEADYTKPFTGLQAEDARPAADSFALVESPVRQGGHAARITVRQGYSRFGHNEDTELVWHSDERDGNDYWYAWSTLFPSDWTAPWKWGIFAQWHANLGTSPIISFNAREDTAELNVHSGLTDESANAFAFSRDVPLLTTLSKGRWNDFVLHVRWSSANDGLIDVFHRIEGQDSLRRLVSLRSIPTFQFTRDGKGVGTYLLLGLYRGSYCSQPTALGCTSSQGEQRPSLLYVDGFTRAGTFAEAVAQAFPGPAPRLPSDDELVGGTAPRLTPHTPDVLSTSAVRAIDPGCGECSVTLDSVGLNAIIAGPQDGRDTAVAAFPVRQRSALIVRQRLRIPDARQLTGNLTVVQVRDAGGHVLVEVYVADDRTLHVFSPPRTLTSGGFNAPSGISVAGHARSLGLRLTTRELQLTIDGRVRAAVEGLSGPAARTNLTVRVGIDHYDGDTDDPRPIRVAHDRLVVGAES